ncbi:hemagglutinin repeat-containing protein [Paraburkholderia solisilvae]|uniref:tRNA nuclease CdiA-2 n=2 Tax=Paraburkholderia solisilvae TaxID=624376 RepID=A0A6J5DRL4_9BURK|nr:tRNA nuclease CdiA-2 [Paraburkholderia solisilvae]
MTGVLPEWSVAQIIPSGPNSPSVISTQNGLPQVNINRPSGAGVSMNTYGQFDVQQRGAILNNSPAIVQTQQAGMINGNPNLGPGDAARVIVNQVNSNAASQINGYVEVAGRRAEVVIANGSGISVNGGGFINTSRAILTTGTPNFAADGSLAGFDVSRGLITVQGAGLNASEVDQVDLIARAVQVNAAIYAKSLNVVAGANSVDHETLDATRIAGDGPPPGVSIDVSQLGGMYANRIWLVGNEYGVGVSSKGVLAAQAGDLTLTSDGKLVLAGEMVANGNINASARDGIDNSGTVHAQQNVNVASQSAIANSGTLAAGGNATLVAGSTLVNAGTVAASGRASVAAATFDNSGGTLIADQVTLHAMNLLNRGGGIRQSGSGTTVIDVAGSLNNAGGTVATNGALDVHSGTVSNRGGTLAAQTDVTLSAASLDNSSDGYVGARTVSVTATDSLNNTGGTILADSTLSVSAQSVANDGGSIANSGTGLTTVSASSAVTNTHDGLIGGNGDVTVTARTLSNTSDASARGTSAGAQIIAGRDLTLNIAQLVDNTNATLSGVNNVTLNGPNATFLNVGGSVHGNGVVTLNAASLDNTTGRIGNDTGSGGSVAIATNTLANQNGAIGSDRNLDIVTGSLTGDGSIIAGHDGTLTIGSDYTLGGANRIQANHDLTFTTAGAFTNQGTLGAVGALTVNAASVDNQAGADLNSSITTVNASGAIINAGRIEGDSVTTHGASLVNSATIVGNTVTLNAGSIVNAGAAAAIAAASAVRLYGLDVSNTGGATIFSLGDISIAADDARDGDGVLAHRSTSVTNDQSTIEAQGNIEIAAQTLTNTRPAPTVGTVTTDVETVHGTKRDRYMACTPTNADAHSSCTQEVWDYGYLNPLDVTFSKADIVSTASGANAADRVLVVNVNGQPQTIYYNTLTTNADGTITVSYWDAYDPHVNFDPASEYPGDDQAHHHYQRVEVARDTTTTTQQDTVTGPQAQQAQITAGGNITLANVGRLNNEYSAIGAGGSIRIGSAGTDGDAGSGSYGGTLVNNIGQTLYQYQRQDIVSTYAWNEDISRDRDSVVQPSIILTPVAIGGLGGTIVANSAVQISATDLSNTNVAAANSATGATGGTLGANGAVNGIVNAPQSILGPDGVPAFTLPSGGLYALNASPGASHLVVTDPRLSSYAGFISSDYMLGQLGFDPSKTIKRLGDGVYEQQLIRNQITRLTGRVYLQDYASNEDEYRTLMTNGVHVAQAFSLVPGMALTAAQMDALTSDIVWLVNQTVTLPDGSTQTVLAPVVYLAHTHANDLQPGGALIAADDVEIHAPGSATNSGVIRGGTQTVIGATDIVNRGGAIGSGNDHGTTVISATNDVINASGRITGNRVAVLAGHDIVNTTLVDTVGIRSMAGDSRVSQTLQGAQGTIASTGDMVIAAGHDLTVRGASLEAGDNAQIAAGHDMVVDTVESHISLSVTKNTDNYAHTVTTLHQSSGISAGGSLAMQSGNDMTFKGATVSAGGDLAVVAGGNLTATTVTDSVRREDVTRGDKTRSGEDRSYDERAIGTSFSAGGSGTLAALSADGGKGNVTLTGSALSTGTGSANIAATGNVSISEAREEHDSYSAVQSRRGSFVHGSTTNEMQDVHANVGVSSTISGDSVTIRAGKDLTVKGSTVAGTNDVNLAAAGNVTITTSQDTQSASSYYSRHESGIGTSGGIGISVGSQTQTDTAHDTTVTNSGSTIGSLNGSLNLVAGNDLHVTGSDLIAAKNVTGTGANVEIDAATDTAHHDESHEVKKSGFTLALRAPVIDAVSNTVNQSRDASRSQDDRAAALHGIAAASGAFDAGVAAGGVVKDVVAGTTPQGKLELGFGSSRTSSTLTEDSTTSRGSDVIAGGTAAFVATGNGTPGSGNLTIAGSSVNATDVVLAAQNRISLVNTTGSDSTRSTNESSSGSIGVSVGTGGLGIDASASRSHGNANADSVTQNNTHVTAANTVTILSGGDTAIIGANVNGRQVNADVGGNLTVASVQDTVASAAHQDSQGGGFAISTHGGSASYSAQHGNADGDYAQVNEQAGIRAGDGGFSISVRGNTDLQGAVIASEADTARNTLSTGTLTFSDIRNQSDYHAHSGGFSAGATAGDGGSNYSTHGPASGTNAGGGAPMVSQNGSGSDSATTRSGISAGTISVTDAARQGQDIASLNRNTSETNGTVAKPPDVNNLLDRQADMMAAAGAAGEAVSRRIGDFAQSKYDEAKAKGDQAGMEAWKEGGIARAEMQAAGAALVTGLAGGNAIGGAAGAGIASIAAGKLNGLGGAIEGANPTGNTDMNQALGNIVANVIATGAGGVIGGDSGAFSGYTVDRYNRQLHPDEYALAKKDAKVAAQRLGISEQQAEGRIVAEILRNSDKQTSDASGGVHDYEIRAVVGCERLNCDAYKNDPQYTNHDYNSQYIANNQQAYDAGQSQLGKGKTYDQLVAANYDKDPVGNTIARAFGTLLAGSVAGGLASVWAAGTAFTNVGDALSYQFGLSADQPSYKNAAVAGVVAAATSPLLLPLNALGGSFGTKTAIAIYNSAVSGTGAFGTTAITNPGSSPDLSAGLGMAGALLTIGGKAILPSAMGSVIDTGMQILPGPAQAAIEKNGQKAKQ